MRIHLITAESPQSRRLRGSRFPQLTMPLIAAPDHRICGSRVGLWWNPTTWRFDVTPSEDGTPARRD